MGSNPIGLCPYKKGMFGHKDRLGHVEMETEIRVMHLQVKECQKLPGNSQKLGERHGTDSLSEGTNPANTLTLDFYPPEL